MKKIAVILANLGGPDSPEAVQPFLFSLFSDPAIITLPQPFRWLLAKLISTKRAPVAQEIYAQIGGKSPILELTQQQAADLESLLNQNNDISAKVFVVMRHWKPFSDDVVKKVKHYNPDEIIFLPLYPQFSTTTTGSSIKDWQEKSKKHQLTAPCRFLCCYPLEKSFIQAHCDLITASYNKASQHGTPRILFSAHGLPKKIVDAGDPYQWQVEQTVAAIVEKLNIENLDWKICYQSRVGRLEWIKPATETEIERAGKDQLPLVVVPITFVSEHSETLVELDIEYKKLAEEQGVNHYFRVPALGTNNLFMRSLHGICESVINEACDKNSIVKSCDGKKICPNAFSGCIYNKS